MYSLYNSELIVAINALRRSGWSDAGSPFVEDWASLGAQQLLGGHWATLLDAALDLGFTEEHWPNWPQAQEMKATGANHPMWNPRELHGN